ncbi:MAG: hypothetical protein Q9225_007987 [Loekoesia sp. 1 TL-2023]
MAITSVRTHSPIYWDGKGARDAKRCSKASNPMQSKLQENEAFGKRHSAMEKEDPPHNYLRFRMKSIK